MALVEGFCPRHTTLHRDKQKNDQDHFNLNDNDSNGKADNLELADSSVAHSGTRWHERKPSRLVFRSDYKYKPTPLTLSSA